MSLILWIHRYKSYPGFIPVVFSSLDFKLTPQSEMSVVAHLSNRYLWSVFQKSIDFQDCLKVVCPNIDQSQSFVERLTFICFYEEWTNLLVAFLDSIELKVLYFCDLNFFPSTFFAEFLLFIFQLVRIFLE